MAKKATTTKVEKEVKAAEVKAVATTAEAVKEEAPKAETKTAAKTTKTTKTTKAKETKVSVTVEFNNKNTSIDAVVEAVKEAYKAEGNKDAVETVELFVQPENNVAYYVVNGKAEGKSVNL